MTMQRRDFVRGLGLGAMSLGAAWPRSGRVLPAADASAPGRLPRSDPQAQGISPAGILQFLDAIANEKFEMHSFLLMRHGQVVSEGWWTPYRRNAVHGLYSLSKSFTSTAVGLAVAEDRLKLSDAVTEFFPEQVPAQVSENLAALQVRHLLTMSVGHERDSIGAMVGNPKQPDWARTFLSLPIEHAPGSVFLYDTGASFMLSAIVQKVTGQKLIDYLQPRLFAPLQISDGGWETNPLGIDLGGWGLSLTTESLAKFGQLYLQRGRWEGKTLLPAAWVEEATSAKIQQPATWNSGSGPEVKAISATAHADPNTALMKLKESSDWYQGYAYQFWRCRHNAFRGDGAYGQFCLVMPDQDAVLAITSETGNMQGLLNLVWEHLLPAMQGPGTIAAPSTRRNYSNVNLQHRMQTLELPLPAGGPNAAAAAKISGKVFKLEPNALGARSVSLVFDDAGCTFALSAAAAGHEVQCGLGQWRDGTTSMPGEPPGLFPYFRHPPGAVASLKVAAAAGWLDADTFVMVWRFYETPHHDTVTCRFSASRIEVTFLNSITALLGADTGAHPEGRPVLSGTLATG